MNLILGRYDLFDKARSVETVLAKLTDLGLDLKVVRVETIGNQELARSLVNGLMVGNANAF